MDKGRLQALEDRARELASADARLTLELIEDEVALLEDLIPGEEHVKRILVDARTVLTKRLTAAYDRLQHQVLGKEPPLPRRGRGAKGGR